MITNLKIKSKLSSTWNKIPTLLFELYEGQCYVYEDFHSLNDGIVMEDCCVEFCVNDKTIQLDVIDGYLQNFDKLL